MESKKFSNKVVIHYDDILATYHRLFWRKWDLEGISDRFDEISSGVESIVKRYGEELNISPVNIKIEYEGKDAKTDSYEDAAIILSNKFQQRKGLKEVSTDFSTSDNKISGKLQYLCADEIRSGMYGPQEGWCVQASLEVKGFTEEDMGKYIRLYNVLHRKK